MVAADAIFDARLGSPMVLTQEEQGWANSAYWAEFEHRHWVNAKGDMFELIVEAHATQVDSKPLQMMLRHCSLAIERAVVSVASTLDSHFWVSRNVYKWWRSKSAATASSWNLISECIRMNRIFSTPGEI